MKREDMFGNVEILLFDILQELKKLNGEKEEIKEETKQYPCKACGGVHFDKVELMQCAKKKKKEGAE